MFSRTYYFNKEKTQYVQLQWQPAFKNLTVIENGVLIGKFQHLKEAQKGKVFILSKGEELFVRLDWRWYSRNDIRRFEILLNGEHIKGSIGHPKENLISVSFLLVLITVLYTGLGLFADVNGHVKIDIDAGMGIYSLAMGSIIFVAGCFVVFGYSKKALIIVAGIMLLDIVCFLFAPGNFFIHYKSSNLVNFKHVGLWVYIFKSVYFVLLLLFIADFNNIKRSLLKALPSKDIGSS